MESGSSRISQSTTPTIPVYGYQSGNGSPAVTHINFPNQLPSGLRSQGKDLPYRDIARSEHLKPFIPIPFSEQLPTASPPLHELDRLRKGSLLKDINVAEAAKRNPVKMLERIEKLQLAMGRTFTGPKLLAPDVAKGSNQPDLKMDDMGHPLLTFNQAMSMLSQLQDMKAISKERIRQQGQTVEAWKEGLLTRLRLEQLHTELVAVAEYYCDLHPESYLAYPFSSPVPDSASLPPVTLSPPNLWNRPVANSVISREAFEAAERQYDIKALQKENESLAEQLSALQHRPVDVEQGSVATDSMEDRLANLEERLFETQTELRKKQEQSLADHQASEAETRGLKEKIGHQTVQLGELSRQIDDLNQSLSDTQKQAELLSAELDTRVVETGRLNSELEAIRGELLQKQQSIQQREALQAELLQKLEDQQQIISHLEDRMEALRSDLQRERINQKEKQVLEAQVRQTEGELENARALRQKQTGQISELQGFLTEEQTQVTQLTEAVNRLLAEKEKVVADSEAALSEVKTELQESHDNVERLTGLNNNLQETLDQANSARAVTESELEEAVKARFEVEEKLASYSSEVAERESARESDLKQVITDLENARAELDQAQAREQQLLNVQKKTREEIERNESQMDKVWKELAKAQAIAAEKSSQSEAYERTIQTLKDSALEAGQTIENLKEEQQNSDRRLKTATAEYQQKLEQSAENERQLQETLTAREQKISDLESTLQETQQLLSQEKEVRAREQSELETEKNRADELSDRLQLSESANDELEKRHKELQGMLSEQEELVEETARAKEVADEKLSAREADITQLNQDIAAWEEKASETRAELESALQDKTQKAGDIQRQLMKKAKEAEQKISALEKERHQADADLVVLREGLETAEQREAELKTCVAEQKQQIHKLQAAKQELENELLSHKEIMADQAQTLESFNHQLDLKARELESQQIEFEAINQSSQALEVIKESSAKENLPAEEFELDSPLDRSRSSSISVSEYDDTRLSDDSGIELPPEPKHPAFSKSKTEFTGWVELAPVVVQIRKSLRRSEVAEQMKASRIVESFESDWDRMNARKLEFEERHRTMAFKGLSLDGLPSKAKYNEGLTDIYSTLHGKVEEAREKYGQLLANKDSDLVYEQLLEAESATRHNLKLLAAEKEYFETEVVRLKDTLKELNSDLKAGNSSEMSDRVIDDGFNQMLVMLKDPSYSNDEELSSHGLCVIAKSVADSLLAAGRIDFQQQETPDRRHQSMQQYLASLKRLLPDNLPASIRKSLTPLSRKYLLEVVKVTEDVLRRVSGQQIDDRSTLGDSEAESLESSMLRDPRVAERVLTLIGSLKDRHQGIQKNRKDEPDWQDYDYAKASLTGLRRIRDEFQLPETPVMKDVLKAVFKDVQREDSEVLAAAVRQHHGRYDAKGDQNRKEKLQERCKQLLKAENALTQEQQLRGVSFREGKRAEHLHKNVLAAFARRDGLVGVEDQATSESGFICRKLKEGSAGLLNSLLARLGGSAVMKVSPLTGDAVIELQNVECRPALVFESSNQKEWQVMLNGDHWHLDPGFLLDNPNFKVPFQASGVNEQRDRSWVPVRNSNGETAILVLQKTPPSQQCFLYEMGDSNNLVPVPIQGGDPLDEIKRATFLWQASQLTDQSPAVTRGNALSEEAQSVAMLSKDSWLPKVTPQQLEHCFQQSCEEVDDTRRSEPFDCVPAQEQIQRVAIRLPVTSQIMQVKSGMDNTGVRLDSFSAPRFENFSVDASFDLISRTFQETMSRQLESDNGYLETLMAERKAFSQDAFKDMTVFSGCELISASPLNPLPLQKLKESRHKVAVQFDKVLKSNQSHCMRLAQHKEALESGLVRAIRRHSNGHQSGLSNRALLDFTINNFERGRVAEWMREHGFIERLVELMLTEIDLTQRTRLDFQLYDHRRKLQTLDYQAFDIARKPEAYRKQCQEWNLEMALLASKQQNIMNRIQSYERQLLTPETMALLCFERRHGIVLTPDQARELKVVLEGVHRWSKGEEVAMISHKGTGYGKSTIILALTDSASSRLGESEDRSVVIMAPESNQAELDILLNRYYGRKGLRYQRLDMAKLFAPPNNRLTPDCLAAVKNVLLGLPEDTAPAARAALLKGARAPVGASIIDIQVLMQLRHTLQEGKLSTDEDRQLLLALVDENLDLLRNSMLFADEFDSAMMPHSEKDLALMADKVAGILGQLSDEPVEIRPADILVQHAEFILGSKARSLLSATVATPFALSLVSGTNTPTKAREMARTDPFTTSPRFWHFMSKAEPVFYSSAASEGKRPDETRKGVISHVLSRVGGEAPIVYFDGLEPGEQCSEKAAEFSQMVNEQRQAMGAPTKGVIYYDDAKHLQMQRKQDRRYEKGAPVSEDMETLLRRSGSRDTDGYLSRAQSVGTDIPQGIDSVGIFDGALYRPEGDYRAREDLLAQRLGRLMRAGKDLHKTQRLFMAVDLEDIKKLEKSSCVDAFNSAQTDLEEKEATLFSQLSIHREQLGEPLKTAVLEPLKVPPADWQNTGSREAVKTNVQEEIARLADSEWLSLDLSEEQVSALRAFKQSQWQLKNSWLELMAEQSVLQEVNPHTVKCESSLVKARVNSCLDRVYADEYNWLQQEGVNAIRQCEVRGEGLSEGAKSQVIPAIKGALETRLSRITRRNHDGKVAPDQLSEAVSFELSRENLKAVFSEIRQQGVTLPEQDVVTRPRSELVEQSREALIEARDRVFEVYNLLVEAGQEVSGKERFESILQALEQRLDSLDKSGAGDTAIQTEALITRAYEQMMDATMKLVLTEQGYKFKSRHSKKPLDKFLVQKLRQFVTWNKDYRLTSDKSSVNRTQLKEKMGLTLPTASRAGSHLYKFRWYTTSPQLNNPRTQTGKLLGTLADRRYDKAAGNFSVKEPLMSNQAEFRKKVSQLQQVQRVQLELEEAKTVCSQPDDERFQKCVEDLETALMAAFEPMAKRQEQKARAEQRLVSEQRALMQSHLYKTHV